MQHYIYKTDLYINIINSNKMLYSFMHDMME